MERLHKFLSRCGVASRREAEALILQGRITVNGRVVQELGLKIDPQRDRVALDGIHVKPQPLVYIALNKPRGFITSVEDREGRPTVMDLLKGLKTRVYPVGRLDMDSEGLLLLTNDGELAFRLMHPRYHVEKRYLVKVKGNPPEKKLEKLRRGIRLEEEKRKGVFRKTAPARIKVIKGRGKETVLEVVLKEGRKRQIRRMFQAIGHPVVSLVRVAIGNVTLEGLPKGKYRHLTAREVQELKKKVGLA
jgi:23S rRNA pseudouridine2605 synthase